MKECMRGVNPSNLSNLTRQNEAGHDHRSLQKTANRLYYLLHICCSPDTKKSTGYCVAQCSGSMVPKYPNCRSPKRLRLTDERFSSCSQARVNELG